MERIQLRLASLGLEKTGQKWSMSFGCALLSGKKDTAERIIERADLNMYKHKKKQKNKIGKKIR